MTKLKQFPMDDIQVDILLADKDKENKSLTAIAKMMFNDRANKRK